MWTWVGRIFRGGSAEAPATLPEWARRRTADKRDVLLLELLDALGGPGGVRAATRLHEIVLALPMSHRVPVDEMLRRRLSASYPGGTLPWLGGPDDVRRLSVPVEAEGAVFSLLSSLPSGYVREAAVQRLALVGTGDELPPLLLRANDWVAPVRARALDALRARLLPEYAPHWIRALRLVLRLRETGRGDTRPLVDAVLELLHRDDAHGAVHAGMYTPDALAARVCFMILLRPGAPDLADVVARGLSSGDIVVRTEAARAAAHLNDTTLRPLLPGMLADSSVRVRIEALELAANRLGRSVAAELRPLLLDRSAAGRARRGRPSSGWSPWTSPRSTVNGSRPIRGGWRRPSLRLLAARDKWEGLAPILRACADADDETQREGRVHLRRWMERVNRNFTQPTGAQQERIRAALDGAAAVLDRQRVKSLRFLAGVGG